MNAPHTHIILLFITLREIFSTSNLFSAFPKRHFQGALLEFKYTTLESYFTFSPGKIYEYLWY